MVLNTETFEDTFVIDDTLSEEDEGLESIDNVSDEVVQGDDALSSLSPQQLLDEIYRVRTEAEQRGGKAAQQIGDLKKAHQKELDSLTAQYETERDEYTKTTEAVIDKLKARIAWLDDAYTALLSDYGASARDVIDYGKDAAKFQVELMQLVPNQQSVVSERRKQEREESARLKAELDTVIKPAVESGVPEEVFDGVRSVTEAIVKLTQYKTTGQPTVQEVAPVTSTAMPVASRPPVTRQKAMPGMTALLREIEQLKAQRAAYQKAKNPLYLGITRLIEQKEQELNTLQRG